MATLRTIKRRIASVKSTQQITNAMKMVAAAKLRKAQNQLLSARPYAHELGQVIGHVAARSRGRLHPLLTARTEKRVCYVLLTADRGLCGSFNSNLIRRAVSEWEKSEVQKKVLVTIGRKGYDYFHRRKYPISHHFIDLFNNLKFEQAQAIASVLMTDFLKRRYDSIYVIYNEFRSVVQQNIVVEKLLPFEPVTPEEEHYAAGFLFDPNPEVILKELCPKNLNVQMWRILLESSASELGARMTAMETATDNAEEMLRELVLYYNKARQAAITKELNEITSGAEALKA